MQTQLHTAKNTNTWSAKGSYQSSIIIVMLKRYKTEKINKLKMNKPISDFNPSPLGGANIDLI